MKPSILNRFFIPLFSTACLTSPAIADIVTKTGSGTDLTQGINWTGGSGVPTSTDIATWDSNSLGAGLTAATDVNWGSINISDAAEAIGITGAGKITTGDITLAGNRTLSIANKIALSGASIFTIADVTGTTANDATLSAEISGAYSLTKSGSGTLRLSGVNIYTGGTNIDGGTLSVILPTALPSTGTINIGASGSLELTASGGNAVATYDRTISGSGAINLTGTSLPVFQNTLMAGFTGTININLTGSNAYKKVAFDTTATGTMPAASSTINVSNGNTLYLFNRTYAGTVNVQGPGNGEAFGALRLDSTTLSGSVHLLGDTSIGSNTSSGGTISGNIDGAFGLNKVSANPLILSGANTYTGATKISAGTVSVSTSANLGGSASNLIFDGGTLQITGTTMATLGHTATFTAAKTVGLDINNAAHTFTVDQVLNQTTGGFTKLGAGTAILTQANSYTGATSVQGGKLVIASGGSVSSTVNNNFVSNGILEISGAYATTGATGGMSTAGVTSTIDIKSGGTFNAGGSNGTFIGQNVANTDSIINVSGTYNHTAGNFILANNQAGAKGTLTVNNGGLVTFASTMPNSSGSGSGAASGLVLGRDNATATGTINLETGGVIETAKNIVRGTGIGNFKFNGGTLKALADSTNTGLDVTTTTVNSGGAIVDTNGFNFLITDAMVGGTGSGGLTKNGAGTLTLKGVNTYTGGTTVNGGTLTLADNAQLAFVIGANGVNNQITGTGTVTLAGDFNLNLTGASTTTGHEWTLVDVGTLTETFDTTFTLVGFSKSGGVHTKVVAGSPTVTWTFTESDGKLKVASGTDYDTWLSSFTFAGGADTTLTGDAEGDGLTNEQEYAFGLNPTSGSSVSPVTVILNKTTGTFTYTRRKPLLTGMTYRIETSTTLAGWSEDATATQFVTGTVGDIETVQVTLSGPIPLTASKLFVRAAATQP